jgi:hypothetical protein
MRQIRAAASCPSIFVGDVAPMNVASYVCRCHVTDEYILNSSVLKNKLGYVRRRYIRRHIDWLTDEFILYASVLLLYSSV